MLFMKEPLFIFAYSRHIFYIKKSLTAEPKTLTRKYLQAG